MESSVAIHSILGNGRYTCMGEDVGWDMEDMGRVRILVRIWGGVGWIQVRISVLVEGESQWTRVKTWNLWGLLEGGLPQTECVRGRGVCEGVWSMCVGVWSVCEGRGVRVEGV